MRMKRGGCSGEVSAARVLQDGCKLSPARSLDVARVKHLLVIADSGGGEQLASFRNWSRMTASCLSCPRPARPASFEKSWERIHCCFTRKTTVTQHTRP